MSLSWKQFAGAVTNPRFIQPIWSFDFRVDYVPVVLTDQMRVACTNITFDAVVNAMQNVKNCPLSALSLTCNELKTGENNDADVSYFDIVNSMPVYDFMLQVGARTLRIQKIKSSLQDLIATVPILEAACAILFPPPADTLPPSFVDLLSLRNRIHRVSFRFEHRLRVTNHITEPGNEATNVEIIAKLVRTSPPPGQATSSQIAPIVTLEPFSPYRGDVTLSVEKTIAKRKRNVWMMLEAPYNISQKDLDLTFSYRMGEGHTELKYEDLRDWTTPVTAFYRDIILNQFMPALFHDINIEPRIA